MFRNEEQTSLATGQGSERHKSGSTTLSRKERILARAKLDEAIYLAGYQHGIAKAKDAIPTSWLDPLLTGPDAVFGKGGPWGCPDIERLLGAIKARLTVSATAEDNQ